MKHFMFLYKGEPTTLTAKEQEAETEAWTAWIEDCGDAIIDAGAPIGHGVSVVDDGTEDDAEPITGYSIVQAHNLTDAKRLTAGHPFLSEGEGDYSIEIYEIFPLNL